MSPVRRNLVTVAGLMLLIPAGLAAQRPAVGVELRIEASNFARNLFPNVQTIESGLTSYLLAKVNDDFGFVSWEPLRQDRSRLAAILRVSITGEDVGAFGKAVSLELSAERGPAGARFDCAAASLSLSEPFGNLASLKRVVFEPQEKQSPGQLVPRIKKVLDEALGNPDFGDRLSRAFLRAIPLCHDAELEDGILALGVGRKDLQADEGSLLQLDLCASSGEGGQLCLEAAPRTLPAAQLRTRLGRCEESSWTCRFGRFQGEACEQKIPFMFQHRLKGSIDVFMIDYRPGLLGTDGKLSTTPGKG